MTETRRGRIEQVILSNLADVHHGHENIPYEEQGAASRLAELIDDGRNPWALRDREGVIEWKNNDRWQYAEVDFLLTKEVCEEIENHPNIDLGTEADR